MIYSPASHKRICPIFVKSISAPGTPWNFAYAPSNNSVIAVPMIFGPAIMKTVLRIAAKKTPISAVRRGRKYRSKRRNVALKSFGFSPSIIIFPPPGPPGGGPPAGRFFSLMRFPPLIVVTSRFPDRRRCSQTTRRVSRFQRLSLHRGR